MTKDEMRLGHVLDSIQGVESYWSVGQFWTEWARENAKELANMGEVVRSLSDGHKSLLNFSDIFRLYLYSGLPNLSGTGKHDNSFIAP